MFGIRIHGWIVALIVGGTMIGCATRRPDTETELASLLASIPQESSLASDTSTFGDEAPAGPAAATANAGAVSQVQHLQPSPAASISAVEHLQIVGTPDPFSVRGAESPNWSPPERWELAISDVIQIALANSTVLRDLGARVVQAPALTPTIYGPAIVGTDATTGIEAALSAFDAEVTTDLFFEDNDQVLNNEFIGQGNNFFEQQLARFRAGLSKRAATGTLFSLRHNFEGDLNNAQRNLIDGRAWTWDIEGEIRQPLGQGRGVDFNRIAGPEATAGVFNGVLIARLNTDISVAQLEIALRDYLTDVENAYWDLVFAYKDLQVKTSARDRSLNTYQLLQNRSDRGLPGAERGKVAQAKEQYFRFEEDVQNALGGRLIFGTRAFNGSGGGTFQGVGGVYSNERRLRLIMGLPINDGRLIYPSSEPPLAPVSYDWNSVVSNALARRTELRRQQLNVERRQLEVTASRNFTQPRIDAVGTYRYRALGDRIYDPNISVNSSSIATGTYEWRMGVSMAYPVGFRKAHSGVRSAQLQLARERDLLREIERQVVYGVSNAIAENDRAYEVLRLAKNRTIAAREQYDTLVSDAQREVRQFDFNALLDSERRLAEAETNENRAEVQYGLAVKNLHFEMGTLLEYFNIHLSEGNWPRRPVTTQSRLHRLLKRARQSLPGSHHLGSSSTTPARPVSTTAQPQVSVMQTSGQL